jgi:hypothetical protein
MKPAGRGIKNSSAISETKHAEKKQKRENKNGTSMECNKDPA